MGTLGNVGSVWGTDGSRLVSGLVQLGHFILKFTDIVESLILWFTIKCCSLSVEAWKQMSVGFPPNPDI